MEVANKVFEQAAAENITVVAASGDQGGLDGESSPTVNFPASDPYVLAVGGTSLYYDNPYQQTAWGGYYDGTTFGSGGGFSANFSRPYFQAGPPGINSTMRGLARRCMVANPETGVLVVTDGTERQIGGGTSVGAPIWSASLHSSTSSTTGRLAS